MQLQYGRSVGMALMALGALLLCVQLFLWVRVYSPALPKKSNVAVGTYSDPAPTKLPALLGTAFVLGGVVLFSANLRRSQDEPARPGPKV